MAKFIVTIVRKSVGQVEVEADTQIQAKSRVFAQFEAGKPIKTAKPWKEYLQIRSTEKKRV